MVTAITTISQFIVTHLAKATDSFTTTMAMYTYTKSKDSLPSGCYTFLTSLRTLTIPPHSSYGKSRINLLNVSSHPTSTTISPGTSQEAGWPPQRLLYFPDKFENPIENETAPVLLWKVPGKPPTCIFPLEKYYWEEAKDQLELLVEENKEEEGGEEIKKKKKKRGRGARERRREIIS